jgi:hypothetical protein
VFTTWWRRWPVQEGSVCALLGQNFCLLRSTWIFACNLQFDWKPLSFIFFHWFALFFQKKQYKKKKLVFPSGFLFNSFLKAKNKRNLLFLLTMKPARLLTGIYMFLGNKEPAEVWICELDMRNWSTCVKCFESSAVLLTTKAWELAGARSLLSQNFLSKCYKNTYIIERRG